MKSKLTLSILALLGLSIALGVNAAGQARGMKSDSPMPNFTAMDTNSDNKVSADEFNAFKAQRMQQRASEGRQMKNVSKAATFDTLDTNGDGYIDQTECQNQPKNGGYSKGGRGKNS
ncbi:EF-hand domain-containing protein [Vibrio breoganii]|uniref:EF-hand domain-containing protein n=1 Tax=Vibrio breoganii TaxID=553239 RepID=UPI000C83E9FB|nr:EF-hand domain-containing protein [Vibrio breoganii]MDN3714898.1 EF-hand domain-containing protein [Vibrio breoganii]PMG91941.1 hypothetical protein BCU80_11530 [Vibrio breoganii]PMK77004.1 hypothetical protein BCT94_06545 [Vibrio breoganii]TKG29534.1 EF-hand domain-containing protein [Vibrio breoganii]